ncbi:MAG: VWA domain-containing protein [Anaeromyxobacteraceae bacterium]
MEHRLTELAGLLRANGVRVSPAEVTDAVRAAALAGTDEREPFRAALRATLVKRARDVPVFEALFAVWFSGLGRLLEGLEKGLVSELEAQGLLEGDELEMIAQTLDALVGSMSPVARAALAGDPALLARLFRGASLQVAPPGAGPSEAEARWHGRRLLAAAGGGAVEADLDALERALAAKGLRPGALQLVADRLDGALRKVEDAARRFADLEGDARRVRRRVEALPGEAGVAPTREELERTDAAVRRLARRLKARLVRRERSRRRGALAARRTLRKNMALGGTPARLVFRQRRPERPDLVVLCDVSESVRASTRLMLLFLYALQSLFGRVRTFVFVSGLAEVTADLKAERDPARAADLAVAARAVNLAANSNYGRALRLFHRDHLGAVGRRTTVIVVGDGRTNYGPPEAWVLDELRRKARRLLWVCTEPRAAWGGGDSEMPLYASRCDRVATATSLEELEGLADALVPVGR